MHGQHSIDEAINSYAKYNKKIPLEWPICTSTGTLRTLPKLKANLQIFKKYLISTFYLLTNIYQGRKSLEENNKIFDKKSTKRELKFLLNSKKFLIEKISFIKIFFL